MSEIRNRLRRLEAHGTPAPALVRAWVGFLRDLNAVVERWYPELGAMTPEELLMQAKVEARQGWTPAQMWLQALERAWAAEGDER